MPVTPFPRQTVTQAYAYEARRVNRYLCEGDTPPILMRRVNDSQLGAPSVVITDPAKVLGDQAETVLAFWRHLDRMTPRQWAAARAVARQAARVASGVASGQAAGEAAGEAARVASGVAAGEAAGQAALQVARQAAGEAARVAAWLAERALNGIQGAAITGGVAARASNEIQGAAIMRANRQSFYFLPMFGFDSPEAVLTADREFVA